MFCLIGSRINFFILAVALSFPGSAGAWTSSKYGVAIDAFPQDWKQIRSGDTLVRLQKEFNKDGYGYVYDESITFAVSLGQYKSMAESAEQLIAAGYLLVERSRVQLGDSTLPLWMFFHQATDQEVSWVAMILRGGLVYSFEVRGTRLDKNLPADFKSIIANFHFLADTRQDGWNAIEAHDYNRGYSLFKKLVRAQPADGNALYGLGMAELALGKSSDALRRLKQTDPIIGLGEVRPVLGQAYLQSGDPVRAATIWYQIIRDEPDRETELQTYIANALAMAQISDDAMNPEHRLAWEDFEFLAAVASIDLQDSLMDARSGDFNQNSLQKYEDVGARLQLLLTAMLQHLMVEGGTGVEVHYLSGAFIFRQAISEAIDGMQNADLELLEKAELRLHEGMEYLSAASGLTEKNG